MRKANLWSTLTIVAVTSLWLGVAQAALAEGPDATGKEAAVAISELGMSAKPATTENGEEAALATDLALMTPATVKVANRNESDIPVELDNKVTAKDTGSSLGRLVLILAVILGFGLLAYVGLRKYRFQNRKVSQFEMKILAQHHLGPKKSLAVVRVAGESILIGLTDHHISMIKSLALLDEELPAVTENDMKSGFDKVFSAKSEGDLAAANLKPATPNKTKETRAAKMSEAFAGASVAGADDSEEFAISKIRDVVTRQVRNLKTLE